MKNFYIIANLLKDIDSIVTNKIIEYLDNNKEITYKINYITKTAVNNNGSYTDSLIIPKDCQCVIVVGGDGTLIQAARDLANVDVPIIGVNMGRLGFLAEIEPETIEESLEKLIKDEFSIESRMMLKGSITRDDKVLYDDIALNDIIFSRFGNLRVVEFNIYVNNKYLNFYSADGVIVSTPTGSTAYNLSAGGPILEPGADIIVVTPVASHMIGARSIVLSANADILIEVCENKHKEEDNNKVYFDGIGSVELCPGDKINITKSNLCTKIIKLNSMSFVEMLHKKMS